MIGCAYFNVRWIIHMKFEKNNSFPCPNKNKWHYDERYINVMVSNFRYSITASCFYLFIAFTLVEYGL